MPSQYEVLIDLASSGIKREPEYAVKRFDYGDGFYQQITTGDSAGTGLWTISLNRAFRDVQPGTQGSNAYAARYYGTNGLDGAYVTSSVPTAFPQSRVNYFWYFFKRRMEFGDPFWFVDPTTHKTVSLRLGYLASLITPKFSFNQDPQDALRHSLTVQFRQARGWIAPPGYGQFV